MTFFYLRAVEMAKKFELKINVPRNYSFSLNSIYHTPDKFIVLTELAQSFGVFKEGLTSVSISVELDVPDECTSLPVTYYVVDNALEEGEVLQDWMHTPHATFIWPGQRVIPATSTCLLGETCIAVSAPIGAADGSVTMAEVKGGRFFTAPQVRAASEDTAAFRPFM